MEIHPIPLFATLPDINLTATRVPFADANGVLTDDAGFTIDANGVVTITGIADGGRTNYDLKVGDTTTPDYGMIQFGNAVIGRTSYKAGNIDLDGSILIQNIGGPVTSEIELCIATSTGNSTRLALAKPGVGNASYHSRSMLIAGPAPADTDYVKVAYWQTNNSIFHNLVCDTAGAGADLGVQNDLEVEGDIFVDSIKESTTAAGITFGHSIIASAGLELGGTSITGTGFTVDTTELTQVANIGANAISNAEWGHVSVMDQDVGSSDSVTFQDVTIPDDGQLSTDNITSPGAAIEFNSKNLTAVGTIGCTSVTATGLLSAGTTLGVTGISTLSGGIGIGAVPDSNFLINMLSNQDAGTRVTISNQNAGTGAFSDFRAQALGGGSMSMIAHGSGRTDTHRWGLDGAASLADWAELLSIAQSGLAIGTLTAGMPLILGTETVEAITIDGSDQTVTIHQDLEMDGDSFYVGSGTGMVYANMYAQDNGVATTITAAGKANKVQIVIFGVDGLSNNCTPDHTNDHITIVKAGVYMVHVAITASGAGGDQDGFGFSVYKNNGATEFANVHGHRDMAGGAGDIGSINLSGTIDVDANDTIEVWTWNEDDTDNLTIDDISLTLVQIGGT